MSFNGKVCDLIAKLINDTIVAPRRSSRKINNFTIDTSNFNAFTDTIDFASEPENIYTIVEDLCKSYGYGFKTTLKDGVFTFHLLQQVNKADKYGEQYIEFSNDNANIKTTDYEEDTEEYKNTMLITGEEDHLQIIEEGAGMNRYEDYYECTIPLTWKDELDIEHTYTDEEYNKIMLSLGLTELKKKNVNVAFTGTVDFDSYEYRKDYNVGDIVKIKNEYGISINALIIEVLESEDNENGYEVEPVFEYSPTIEGALLTENARALKTDKREFYIIKEEV